MSTSTGSVYNTTDGPLIVDRAGRVLGAREHRDDVDLDASPVAGHIKAGRLIVTSEAQADAEATDAPTLAAEPRSGKAGRRSSTTTPQEG